MGLSTTAEAGRRPSALAPKRASRHSYRVRMPAASASAWRSRRFQGAMPSPHGVTASLQRRRQQLRQHRSAAACPTFTQYCHSAAAAAVLLPPSCFRRPAPFISRRCCRSTAAPERRAPPGPPAAPPSPPGPCSILSFCITVSLYHRSCLFLRLHPAIPPAVPVSPPGPCSALIFDRGWCSGVSARSQVRGPYIL